MGDNTVQHTGIMLFNDIFDDNKGRLVTDVIGDYYMIDLQEATITIGDDCNYWVFEIMWDQPVRFGKFNSFSEYKATICELIDIYGEVVK